MATPEQIQAFKERNRIGSQRPSPAAAVFTSRKGRGDADAQEGGFYGGGSAPQLAPTQPPPKATDAPSKGQNNQFTGLCQALNEHQLKLEKQFPGYVADQYAIDFAPVAIGESSVVKPGPTTYKNTAPKSVNTAEDKVGSEKDAMNTKSQTWQVQAGTQIVQLIDQIMRSSSYITSQQLVNFDEDGKQTKNKTAGTGGITAWYKISLTTRQLKYDKVRRDHAYRMTFTISPYAINQMASPYFPDSNYRGAHKAYNYWFTGQNTQILNYEQEYNHAYYVTLSGNPDALATAPPSGRDQRKRTYMATSEQRGQGQANYVNEPADSAASFLYSVSDLSEVKLQIVGDPAWMQQGEAAFGVNARTFDFKPFNTDGGINYDSQEVVFTVSFSRPTDYNFNTGIMNTTNAGEPQETFAYIASTCKNVFSKGKFTQELTGTLLPLTDTSTPASNDGRPKPVVTTGGQSRTAAQNQTSGAIAGTGTGTTNIDDGSRGYEVQDETGQVSTLRRNEYGDLYDPDANTGTPTPGPVNPPQLPTSNGDIDYSTESALTPTAPVVSNPQIIAKEY